MLEDGSTGTLTYLSTATGANAGSFMAVSDDKNYLYVSNEQTSGACGVTTFKINSDKTLTKVKDFTTTGGGAAYIAIDPTRKYLGVACYNSGNTAVIALGSDGVPSTLSDNEQFTGSGPNSSRQTSAHVHENVWSADGKFVYIPDLGSDRIWVNSYSNGQITKVSSAVLPSGAGPRHIVLHPTLPYAYSVQELANTVATYSYDRSSGSLTYQSSITTLPPNFTGTSAGAEIVLHPQFPDVPYLYASNRGANTIAVYRVGSDGSLTNVANPSSGGSTPRMMVFKDGWLVVVNSDSSNVAVFSAGTDGSLTLKSTTSNTPTPPYVIAFA
ncbi:hypothetical protein HDV00_007472 [Rhizophlyctis rosea]|nr:hypothetical protein HDV00_007472 [Rhizophlyctis rosea]